VASARPFVPRMEPTYSASTNLIPRERPFDLGERSADEASLPRGQSSVAYRGGAREMTAAARVPASLSSEPAAPVASLSAFAPVQNSGSANLTLGRGLY